MEQTILRTIIEFHSQIGLPNAGKSTLLQAITVSDKERAFRILPIFINLFFTFM